MPVIAQVQIAGITTATSNSSSNSSSSTAVVARRIFGAEYALNLTMLNLQSQSQSQSLHLLQDQMDAWSASVYQIGCDTNAGTHETHMSGEGSHRNLVVNGGFEIVKTTRPLQLPLKPTS